MLAKACIKSKSKLYTQASAMSSGLASAYAKIFAAALAKACTCGGCTCPKIPSKAQLVGACTHMRQRGPSRTGRGVVGAAARRRRGGEGEKGCI